MLNKIKSYMMPISMLTGVIFYTYFDKLSFLTSYLIFIMLFISYCNISLKDIRITKLHLWLISIQLLGSCIIYLLLSPINPILAQGVFMCVFAPTATSAVVITGMLGGNMGSLTSFGLLSNMAVAFVAPIAFTLINGEAEIGFWESLFIICERVFLILLLPFLLSIFIRKFIPMLHRTIRKKQSYAFYLWNFALMIVTGKIVHFLLEQEQKDFRIEIAIAILSFIVCITQFLTGRKLGRKYSDTIAGGQGLGQKNTLLAIWMAQTYLNPISSIGPGAYVLWQNIVNSYQVWKKRNMLQ